MAKSLLIKQTKSTAQVPEGQRLTLKAMGLRGIGSAIYRADTRALRGMCNQVQHLVAVEQVDKAPQSRPKTKTGTSKGFKLN